ncbi:MAG: hypothetical protein Q4G59_11900, partial [Planctomycetia bacterium]|nr:hypothetical protein [Planctomycetia bacterium]
MYCSTNKAIHLPSVIILLCCCVAFVIGGVSFFASSACAQYETYTTAAQKTKTSPWKQGQYPAFELLNLNGSRIKSRQSLALIRFDSEKSLDDWKSRHSLNVSFAYASVPVNPDNPDNPDKKASGPRRGVIQFEGTGLDPYSAGPSLKSFRKTPGSFSGAILARLRVKTSDVSGMGLFWSETDSPGFSQKREASCRLVPDGRWRDYFIQIKCESDLDSFRLDPGQGVGHCELAEVEFLRLHYFPVEVRGVKITDIDVTATLLNSGTKSANWTVEFRHGRSSGKRTIVLKPSAEETISFPLIANEPFTSGQLTFIDNEDGTRFDRRMELFS